MCTTKVIIETGRKRTFACAIDWPGWCRSGRDESSALQVLLEYGLRYAQVLQDTEVKFQAPVNCSAFEVTERLGGNATTDFGAPGILFESDNQPVDHIELERLKMILLACWRVFDNSIQQAAGLELRRGPRGGVIWAPRYFDRRVAWHVLDHAWEIEDWIL